jgi:hypothetical protein
MNFIRQELDRIRKALPQTQSDQGYAELYAAQQSLLWALEPDGFRSPFDMIARVHTKNSLGGSEDCPGENGQSGSSDNLDRRAC